MCLESGTPDRYQLEDGSSVLLLEGTDPQTLSAVGAIVSASQLAHRHQDVTVNQTAMAEALA
jgi:hypothetical protein